MKWHLHIHVHHRVSMSHQVMDNLMNQRQIRIASQYGVYGHCSQLLAVYELYSYIHMQKHVACQLIAKCMYYITTDMISYFKPASQTNAFVCDIVYVAMCMSLLLRLLITCGVKWTLYDWLNKLYSFYMAVTVCIISRHGLRNEADHRNQSNKINLALHKLLLQLYVRVTKTIVHK